MVSICCVNKLTISWLLSSIYCLNKFIESVVNVGRVFQPKMLELEGLCTLCIMNGFAWSVNANALLCTFVIIEVGIPYACSLERFRILVFRPSSLGLNKGEL
jgi:hypothetical protein